MKELKTETGQNQTMTRDVNLSIIMKSFVKKDMSRVDISRTFKLSKPTASKITAELESLSLIRPGEEEQCSNIPGVKPLKYGLNTDLGLLAVIDLSTVEIKILIYNFGGECLSEIKISDKELIRYDDIVSLCNLLDGLLCHSPLNKYELLSVCIAIPCAVNKITGKIYWSARFDIDESFNLYNFLSSRYKAKIIIKNDVQLMLSGEIHKGLLADGDKPYAVLMYIDAGLGGSFYMNGKLEDGAEGTAGDLGFLPFYEKGKTYLLDSVISINAMKKRIRKEIADGAETSLRNLKSIHFRDIENAYFQNDALTIKIVEETANNAAVALKSILEILNVNFVIISGRITKLGDRYREIIQDSLSPHFPLLSVRYSNLGDNAIKEGAIMISRDEIVKEKISNRTHKAD